MRLALVLLALSGCASLPSLEHCEEVSYHRKGAIATLAAKCTLPAGTGITL